MKKRCKVIVLSMVVVMILMALPLSVGAATPNNEIVPLWQNTGIVSVGLAFPEGDGYGYAESVVNGYAGVTKIVADVYVYRQSGSSWVYVTEKHNTTYSNVNGMSCSFVPVSGAYYKAEFTFTVTKGGVDEVITKTKYNTCP